VPNFTGQVVVSIDSTSGVAELLVFHPVDTVAKRLMSNKNKVCALIGTSCSRIKYLACRSRSRQFRLSSSAMLQVNQYFPSCCLYSLVLGMPQATRLLSGYTSSVVSHTSTTSFPGITRHSLQTPLERGRER